jgi:hypothetical protein
MIIVTHGVDHAKLKHSQTNLEMKKLFLLIFSAAMTFTGLSAQGLSSSDKTNNALMVRSHGPNTRPFSSPLYIVRLENKEIQIPDDGNLKDSLSIANALSDIKPAWIESITVLKEQDARDKYSSLGQNGVIFISLKDGTIENLPADVRKKFHDK